MRIMEYWSAFSSSDIHKENEIDCKQLKIMIWLLKDDVPKEMEV